jgi:hypothetical protein
MKKFIILALLVVCLSCEKKSTEEVFIRILNESTDASFHIRLFPKSQYINSTMYINSDLADINNGPFNRKEFVLHPPGFGIFVQGLFTSHKDFTIEPQDLLMKVFDSIHISTVDRKKILARFTPDTVIGYFENIFAEKSAWDYELNEVPKNRRRVKVHTYTFMILESKFINE